MTHLGSSFIPPTLRILAYAPILDLVGAFCTCTVARFSDVNDFANYEHRKLLRTPDPRGRASRCKPGRRQLTTRAPLSARLSFSNTHRARTYTRDHLRVRKTRLHDTPPLHIPLFPYTVPLSRYAGASMMCQTSSVDTYTT